MLNSGIPTESSIYYDDQTVNQFQRVIENIDMREELNIKEGNPQRKFLK